MTFMQPVIFEKSVSARLGFVQKIRLSCRGQNLSAAALAAWAIGAWALGQPTPPVSAAPPASARQLPSVQEMIDARTDVWGDAAMREPNGASYEFFEPLLPPLRWVNTDFRHYPIILSAPRAPQKARLISNGSAVNPRANKPPMWYEQGVPVTFFVGDAVEQFGADLARVETPSYLDGYLPVVTIGYRQGDTIYKQETFAPVGDSPSEHGTAMLRFSADNATSKSRIEARITSDTPLRVQGNAVFDKDRCIVAFSRAWKWQNESKSLVADLKGKAAAELAIYTVPLKSAGRISGEIFDREKAKCIETWQSFIDHSIKLSTPEQLVNAAWRAMLIGTYMTAVGDRLHYSATNAYAKLYEGECGDTLRSVMLFGDLENAPKFLKPLLEFDRQATRFHVAGHKLQLLAWFYWLTRDADTIRAYEPLWRQPVNLIINSREPDSGLLPKDRYAGDIAEDVYSLNSNANCWRGLRDVAAVLEDIGDKSEADQLNKVAAEFRKVILAAAERSIRRESNPPFIPLKLLSDEPAHDPLTATRTGSYYDLMAPYIIGSEIFGQGSEHEDWLIGYLQNHGGIAMGMIRSTPHQGQFEGEPGVNPLYGLRYQNALLRRDDRERSIVGFYGQLAQGMTRGTFIGGEGSRFRHGDENGRSFYLPPNSTSNAAWLVTLRNLLIQDWDLDEDAKPDTLRLLFAAPRRWLADGSKLHIKDAPTQFGPVSLEMSSQLTDGIIRVKVTPPPRPIKPILLRAPVPDGWQVTSININDQEATLFHGDVVAIPQLKGPQYVSFQVKHQ
jgi:hypothetical protein